MKKTAFALLGLLLASGAFAGERYENLRVLKQGKPIHVTVIPDDDSLLLVVVSDHKGVSVRIPNGAPVPSVQTRGWGAEIVAPGGWSFGPGQCIPDTVIHCSPAGCFCDAPVEGKWCDSERQFVNETATVNADYAGC